MAYCGPLGLAHSTFLSWDRDDRDKALIWAARQRGGCNRCGTRPAEWDPALGGHDDAYVAELHQCWGCHATAEAEQKAGSKMKKPGVHVRLVPNPEVRGPRP